MLAWRGYWCTYTIRYLIRHYFPRFKHVSGIYLPLFCHVMEFGEHELDIPCVLLILP